MRNIVPRFGEMDAMLGAWKERWWLDGYSVTCKACGSAQDLESAGQPFLHKEGCQLDDGSTQYPWQVLRQAGMKMRDTKR